MRVIPPSSIFGVVFASDQRPVADREMKVVLVAVEGDAQFHPNVAGDAYAPGESRVTVMLMRFFVLPERPEHSGNRHKARSVSSAATYSQIRLVA